MTPTLAICIVCVPSRLRYAKELYRRIAAPENTSFYCDMKMRGSWHGTRSAWEVGISKNTTHVMEIEEDVIPCLDFYRACIEIITRHPNEIISLYSLKSEKNMCAWARRNNSSYYQMCSSPSGQAVIMPRQTAIDFLSFCEEKVISTTLYEDVRLWGFLRLNNKRAYVTVPNLVQHVGNMESTLGFNSHGKTSADFIGATISGLTINWDNDRSTEKIFTNHSDADYRKSFLAGYTGNPEDVP